MAIFEGGCVALVTPFKNNRIDYYKLKNLIEFQIKNNTSAILILGTTGESSTISSQEKIKIIRFSKTIINGRAKLIVGTGSNNTKTAINNSIIAEQNGADAILVVTPYYNKCTQNGVIKHYKDIAKSVKIPIILYNVPSRTGFNMLPKTIEKLSKIQNIKAIKEANENIEHIQELFYLCKDKIDIYSGNDNLNYIFYCLGAKGTISVVCNIFPDLIYKQYFSKNLIEKQNITNKLYSFCNMCFIEPNPIPIKYILSYKGYIKNELRQPLTKLEKINRQKLIDSYKKVSGDL